MANLTYHGRTGTDKKHFVLSRKIIGFAAVAMIALLVAGCVCNCRRMLHVYVLRSNVGGQPIARFWFPPRGHIYHVKYSQVTDVVSFETKGGITIPKSDHIKFNSNTGEYTFSIDRDKIGNETFDIAVTGEDAPQLIAKGAPGSSGVCVPFGNGWDEPGDDDMR